MIDDFTVTAWLSHTHTTYVYGIMGNPPELWQFYQQSHLVVKNEKHGEEMQIVLMKYLFSCL